MHRLPLVLALVLSVSACASATGTPAAGTSPAGSSATPASARETSVPITQRRNASVITVEEIARAGGGTALDVVQSLRPAWLRERDSRSGAGMASPILVYMDDTLIGGLDALRQIMSPEIGSIRRYNPAEANFRFGAKHENGAIQVVMRGTAARVRMDD